MGQSTPALSPLRRTVSVALAGLALLLSVTAGWAQGVGLEYAVKATYLYKFVPYVEWPVSVVGPAGSAIRLCIVGEDPFGEVLDRAVAGQHIGDRPIAVRRLAAADRAAACHVMYVAGSDAQSVSAALEAVRGTPVLTVTDSARRPVPKGIIHFVIVANRVRFEIDNHAAAENGLVISSKLLSLAVSVRPRA